MLEVSEIFYSLQGESTWAGFPCIFVRLSDCNLRCSYCDAGYTYTEAGTLRSVAEIVTTIAAWHCPLVEITGGEPLIQDDTIELCRRLTAAGRQVLLETNGSIAVAAVPEEVHIIMDVKCPGSGMVDSLHLPNFELLAQRKRKTGRCDEIKFVLSSREDYLWARELIRRHRLEAIALLLLSPVQERFTAAEAAELLLADRLEARLQLQLHKILWPGHERGK
ncbi:7-carboxy-7-deazaguanine synthase QueE [Desulfofustis limnaeus]|jgi:7-carboxy-7-deazaguanine synthase|uniref:7-carboxy-7-deazaguanine synthase n=1 Tax=Desulfofustis limnaeus TaxID=2740163 RepID=A0ABM7W8C4_9BACT|nr:radical SAM protein [Desulfofustis limnaeus]MDX9894354.1 radical SAM protein [Desulfofustis sp.]BDD87237.1 7-carboxy-7-deazaguanine synthase [Desulfofustis limnaeus]